MHRPGRKIRSYLSDPFHPVPTAPGPIEATYGPGLPLVYLVGGRPAFCRQSTGCGDVETEVLKEDVVLLGMFGPISYCFDVRHRQRLDCKN